MRINRGRSGSKVRAASSPGIGAVTPPGAARADEPEADLDPVPAVDRDNQQGQLHLLLFAELSLERLIDVIGSARPRQQGQGFGPGQRCALTVAVERRVPPGIEQIETLLRLASVARVGGMHV